MSASHAAAASSSDLPAEQPRLVKPGTMLGIGLAFGVLTLLGIFLSDGKAVAFAWLIALVFWSAVAIGALMMVMLHHIFDAGWSTVIRRPVEHWLSVFPWLGLLFVPLIVLSWMPEHRDMLWKWMNTAQSTGDVAYMKKSGFLNPGAFTVATIFFFVLWSFLSSRFRRNSFAQDEDGSPEHTRSNRKWAAAGIILTGLSLTFAAFYWMMSLEYRWFSTMYGVWFFAGCMRAALTFTVLICLYLARRGVLRGIFGVPHLLNLGNVMLAFTVFWAYVTFSQYFLIWNANVPEETFWFNMRDIDPLTQQHNSWWWIGMILIFGHFLVPFLFYLQNPLKKKAGTMIFISVWVLVIQLIDLTYNILPAYKVADGNPISFFSPVLPWTVTAVIAVGGICLWSFFRSLARTRCIPIRDPRIVESLQLHE